MNFPNIADLQPLLLHQQELFFPTIKKKQNNNKTSGPKSSNSTCFLAVQKILTTNFLLIQNIRICHNSVLSLTQTSRHPLGAMLEAFWNEFK